MRRKICILVLLALFALLLIFVSGGLAAHPNYISDGLQVSYINVGQGDAALIRDSGGFDVVIDGGRVAAGPTVVAYLRQQGVDDIDVLVASHADADHIGGLIEVLKMADI